MSQEAAKAIVHWASGLWCLLAFFSLGLMLPAFMGVDNPSAPHVLSAEILQMAILTFPAVCIAAVIASNTTLGAGRPTAAFVCALLPLVNLAAGGFVMLLGGPFSF